MNDEFSVHIVEMISTTLLIFEQQKQPEGKLALMRLLTVLLRNYPVPQQTYDKVFKLTIGDTLFETHAFVLCARASRLAQALYRIKLIERGEWTKIQELVRIMALPLDDDEILALGRKMCASKNLVEKTSFYAFVRSHPSLPGALKSTICCYFPVVPIPKNAA